MDRDTLHCQPPAVPSPMTSSALTMTDDLDLPSSLALPILAPRAPKLGRRGGEDTSASLMDFVNLMSITDAAIASTCLAPAPTSSYLLSARSDSPPELNEEDKNDAEDKEGSTTRRRSSSTALQAPTPTQWALTTPETMKTTISTPQALLANRSAHKRKSPLIHSTPVDGNRPLMLPSLSANLPRAPLSHCQLHPGGRSIKKAKNYKSLLSNAPMLPSSPDLEDRVMAAPRFHPPCFSPVGGVTLVNPNYHRLSFTPTPTPPPPPRRSANEARAASAAGLPSLDGSEQTSAPKWLRMKKRTSLLSVLRMAAAET